MSNNSIQEFEESSKIINSSEDLQEKMAKDGYVFLRDLIDREKVNLAKNEIVEVLKEYDYVDKNSKEPKWTGKEYNEGELLQVLTNDNCGVGERVAKLESLRNVITSNELMGVLEKILGGEVYVWIDNFERVRVMLPGKGTIKSSSGSAASRNTPCHQDLFVFRTKDKGDVQFLTVWIPLMNIDDTVGGLGLMKDSHKGGLYKHYMLKGETKYIPSSEKESLQWVKDGAISVDDQGTDIPTNNETWLRTDYRPGDVLIFHRKMAHKGLTNISNTIRLSGDFRYQRKDTTREWQSQKSLAWNFKFRTELKEKIVELGVKDPALKDKISHEIILQGPSMEKLDARINQFITNLK